jgi:hypothetical protein
MFVPLFVLFQNYPYSPFDSTAYSLLTCLLRVEKINESERSSAMLLLQVASSSGDAKKLTLTPDRKCFLHGRELLEMERQQGEGIVY